MILRNPVLGGGSAATQVDCLAKLLGPVLFLAYFRLVPRILVPIFLSMALPFSTYGPNPNYRKVKAGNFQPESGNQTDANALLLAFLPIVIGLGTSCLVLQQQWKDTQKKSCVYSIRDFG